MLGDRCVKTYSSTQDIVASSPGEAEFYGIVKGGSRGLGVIEILRDVGLEMSLQINIDTSAARSGWFWSGAGKVRHLGVRELWIQERASRGDLANRKVHGLEDGPDI